MDINDARDIQHNISTLMSNVPAITSIIIDDSKAYLMIEYDQILFSFSDVLNTLSEYRIYPKQGIFFNWRSSWFDYLDATAQENESAPPAACCNKPPKRQ